MTPQADIATILARYPADCQPTSVADLGGAGGFSGTHLWRISAPRGELCLRQWPREHPSLERLQWMHAVMFYVHARGFHLAPVPLTTRDNTSFVRHAGHLWELTPWLSGEANYQTSPSDAKLASAMQTLAQWHRAAEEFPVDGDSTAPSPGLLQRLEQLDGFLSGGLERLRASLSARQWPELYTRSLHVLDLFSLAAPQVRNELARIAHCSTPLHPCLRDIWHDHVLFKGDQVTGLIDFGAMRVDSPACDVARLLGSLAADDAESWLVGLTSYGRIRPLSDLEARLVTAFDQSAVVLSPLSWIVWIFEEGRTFENPEAVLARFDHYQQRLVALTG